MSVFNIVSIICFSLCLLMFFYFKWYINKRTTESGLEEYRKEIKKLESDINAVTDRNLQLIEDNISKLKMVLEETDKRISVYNTEREKSRTNETLYTSLGRGIRAALKTIEDPASLQQEHQVKLPQQTAQTHIVQPAAVPPEPPDVKPLTKQQIRSAIDSLIMEGLSPEEIAFRLDISIAEVNLAINLFRRK